MAPIILFKITTTLNTFTGIVSSVENEPSVSHQTQNNEIFHEENSGINIING